MTTRAALRANLRLRLSDPAVPEAVWSDSELNSYLDTAIGGLYPSFHLRKVSTFTAVGGMAQTLPSGVRNIYQVAATRGDSGRLRALRHWTEGAGQVFIPRTDLAGNTLVVSWTEGWAPPSTDTAPIVDLYGEAAAVVLLQAHIAALEALLTTRIVQGDKYHAIQVRQSVTEEELLNSIDALHASLRERLERSLPLPEMVR